MNPIPFNRPVVIGDEVKYIQEAINNRKLSGDCLLYTSDAADE